MRSGIDLLLFSKIMFDGSPVKVLVKPHGNAKNTSSYYRTSSSAMKRIEDAARSRLLMIPLLYILCCIYT